MNPAGKMPVSRLACPDCDRCSRPMLASGWIPKPDGHGGLRRLTMYRCEPCDRQFDVLLGYRAAAPGR